MDITRTAATQAYKATEQNGPNNDVDKEFFLKLLVAQMKHQDPLSPTDNNEFISQTAQFTLLEEIQALKTEFAQDKSFNLIGKYVEGNIKNAVSGKYETVGGYVDSVTISAGKPILNLGEMRMNPENVTGVRNE
jgi:flagellar basal-body rod modification protein FlgD